MPREGCKPGLYVSCLVCTSRYTVLQPSTINSQFGEVATFSKGGIVMNWLTGKNVKFNHTKGKRYNFSISSVYTGLIHLRAVWPHRSVLHSCKRCAIFRRHMHQEMGWHWITAAHKNMIMIQDGRLKIHLFIPYPRWFIYRSVSSHRVTKVSDNLQSSPIVWTHCFNLFSAHYYLVHISLFVFHIIVVHATCFICRYGLLLVTDASAIIPQTYMRQKIIVDS